jgi:hypothetical protein
MSSFATILQKEYFAVSVLSTTPNPTRKPTKVFKLNSELPAPDYRCNENTREKYTMLQIAGKFLVRDINLHAVILTNKNLDCTVLFGACTKEPPLCGGFFLGCIELDTERWRWCIPVFLSEEKQYGSTLKNITMHRSSTNLNRVIVYHHSIYPNDPTRIMTDIQQCNICAEEFDALTGQSITRLAKSREPYISFFEFLSNPVDEHKERVDVSMPDMGSRFLGNEDWMRELLTYLPN